MRINPFLVLTLTLSIAACGSKSDDDDNDSGFEDNTDADGTGSDGGTDDGGTDGGADDGGDDSSDPMTAALYGSIVNENGAAMTAADVKLCTALQCKTAEPDGEGNFEFVDIEGATFALEVKGEASDSATIMTFIELPSETVRTIETPIVVPTFKSTNALGSTTTIEVDGGLNISANSNYELPFGTEVEESLKGVKMDADTAGLPLDGIEGEVVGLWYLGTWDTKIDPGWSFTIDGLTVSEMEDVAAGDSLTVLTGDYFGVSWVNEGTATVGEGGEVTSDAGTGISNLSTLILIKE